VKFIECLFFLIFVFGALFLLGDVAKGGVLYLHEKWRQVPTPKLTEESKDPAITKLAIGVEGGFQASPDWIVEKEHSLMVVVNGQLKVIPLPNRDLPEFVNNVIDSVIKHEGMRPQMQLMTWEEDTVRPVSKYALNLVQLNNGKKISQDATKWKCEMSGDTQNLWLNLSTGYIGGGRRNWDGSGGSGAALKHFEETGSMYPLCVKLGTITPHSADVWSYAPDEDMLVTDPLLAEHLSHWGIDIMKLSKTDKTMAEADVALNMSYDWSRLMEGSKDLELVTGSGFVGLTNIGSSCYLNSVLQTLSTVPEVRFSLFWLSY
jgi:ubiquitin carboxyl-terminal hydrolase 5/13